MGLALGLLRLLGLRAEEQFPQPRDGRILVAHDMEQPHIRFDHGVDRGVVFRVEILSVDALEKVFQLALGGRNGHFCNGRQRGCKKGRRDAGDCGLAED
jgi:hypothetical protein